ncbi:MAG: gas vesicle synthesis GvpLGvpF [Streptosporangiales bacterium]|nr:gas vesicle synthesis GvpLGvpF [Streptosporangiales bacterium]
MTGRTDSQPSAPVDRRDPSGPHYVYGVVRAGTTVPGGVVGVGGGEELYLLEGDGLALLAGPIDAAHHLATQRDVLAHARVLDAVAAGAPVLPMRYGTVVDDPAGAVDEIVGQSHERFAELLADLDGAAQYSLRATYHEETVLAEVLAEDPEIRELTEATRGQDPDIVYGPRVRLGELVVGALAAKRRADSTVVLAALTPHLRTAATREPGAPDEVLDVALLVDRSKRGRFEEAVDDVGRRTADRMRLRLIGPQAPYDFVPGT